MRWTGCAALVLLVGLAGCAVPQPPLIPSGAQQQGIAAAEHYLNSLRVFKARFTQTGWLGPGAGVLWVQRPGQLRMTYFGPRGKDVTATGGILKVLDHGNGATSTTPVARTPFGLLLADDVSFGGPVMVTAFEDQPSGVTLTLQDSRHPGQGTLTARLLRSPWRLSGIDVVDARGRRLSLALSDFDLHPVLTPDLFAASMPGTGGTAATPR